ncbi:hypothetical protein OAO01_03730 [Oligoflexia bacterium]|nr:hypothetical protein [Oligoflexia bacterium]
MSVLKALKASNFTAVFDYVDWNGMYDRMSDLQRRQKHLSSAKSLRAYYQKVYHKPEKFLEREMRRAVNSVPVKEQSEAAFYFEAQRRGILKQHKEAIQEYSVAKPKIIRVESDEKVAIVYVVFSKDNFDYTREIRLVHIGERWLLDSLALLSTPAGSN